MAQRLPQHPGQEHRQVRGAPRAKCGAGLVLGPTPARSVPSGLPWMKYQQSAIRSENIAGSW